MKTTFVQVVKVTAVIFLVSLLPGWMGRAQEAGSAQPGKDTTLVHAEVNNGVSAAGTEPVADTPALYSGSNAVVSSVIAPTMPQLSPGLKEVIALAQAQVGEEVLLAYVNKSGFAFNLTAEEVVYLHDLGVSDKVIAAIIQSGKVSSPGANSVASTPPLTAMPGNHPAQPEASAPGLDYGPNLPVNTTPDEIASAPAPVTDFYPNLSPYGSWLQIADYGWCWQPSVAVINAGWRPYADRGRWEWTDCAK